MHRTRFLQKRLPWPHQARIGRNRDHRQLRPLRQGRNSRMQLDPLPWRDSRAFREDHDLASVLHRSLRPGQHAPHRGRPAGPIHRNLPGRHQQGAEQRNIGQLSLENIGYPRHQMKPDQGVERRLMFGRDQRRAVRHVFPSGDHRPHAAYHPDAEQHHPAPKLRQCQRVPRRQDAQDHAKPADHRRQPKEPGVEQRRSQPNHECSYAGPRPSTQEWCQLSDRNSRARPSQAAIHLSYSFASKVSVP